MVARRRGRGGKGQGVWLGDAWGQEKEQEGRCGAASTGMAWEQWLRAPRTTAGGAHRVDAGGALPTGEAAGARRLTCGVGRCRAQWLAAVCERERRE
jgi:hypothetical protein